MFINLKQYFSTFFTVLALMSVFCTVGLNAESRIFDEVTGIDETGRVEQIKAEKPKIILSKTEIYHYDILNVYLYDAPNLNIDDFVMRIFKEDKIHPSAGMEYTIPFLPAPDSENRFRYKAVYLPDWNEEDGQYEIKLYYNNHKIQTKDKILFTLKRRLPPSLNKVLSIVDLEMNESIKNRSFQTPDGSMSDYTALLEWARFMSADALWILAGETTSFTKRSDQSSVWDKGPLENLSLLKQRGAEYKIDIGAYVMSFYVPGSHGVPERYASGIGYSSEGDYLYRSRHISIASERRIKDIIELVRDFQDDEEISYVGLDFIRTGRADGYELGPTVVKETNIVTPEEWESIPPIEQIKWFARQIEVEKDPLIIEKWRWYRAHKVAEIVKRIIEEAEITKPLWVYTLGWNHGKEHGQDPVMFFDAGVSIDAVMLYEANQQQFNRLLNHWKSYIKAGQGNIIIGNCIDYTLLDSESLDPPEELFRRNREGYRNIMRDGFASGIFIHDLARAFWGRRGGYSIKEYALSFISSVDSLKRDLKIVDLVVDVKLENIYHDEKGRVEIAGRIYLKNNGTEPLHKIMVTCVGINKGSDTSLYFHYPFPNVNNFILNELNTFESRRLDFLLIKGEGERDIEDIGLKIEIEGVFHKSIYFNELMS